MVPFRNGVKDDKYVQIFIETMLKYNLETYIYFVVHEDKAITFLNGIAKKFGHSKELQILKIQNPMSWFGNNMNVPTIKKFVGIQSLYKDYDYIAPIDADFKFLKSFDPYQVMDEVWKNKSCFFRNNCRVHNQIMMRNCAYLCGLENNENLIKETKDFTYSCWFNDIPVYDTQHWEEFSKWMCTSKASNGKTPFYNAKFNFSCFDYWMYWFWLICFKDLHDTDYSDNTRFNSLIESLCDEMEPLMYIDNYLEQNLPFINNDLLKLHKEKILLEDLNYEKMINTHWTTRDYDKTKDIAPNDQLCIEFNVDRLPSGFQKGLNFQPYWNV